MLKKIWHDPVWSKVIAAGIVAAVAAGAGIISLPIGQFLLTASPVPHWLLGLLGLIAFSAVMLAARRPGVRITPVGDSEPRDDKTPTTPPRTYPLKVYRVMRNDSTQPIEARIFDYRPGTVTLKKFVTGVLQVQLREWCPDEHGLDRIPVLPGQQFRAWVGVDENKFTKDQLDRLRGQIGTLVLVVNGRRINIAL
jgi:hypothetical protein